MNRAERRRSGEHRDAKRRRRGLAEAIRQHRAGDLRQAERAYAARLQADPGDPDALHYLGVLRHQQGRSDEGEVLIVRALEAAPNYVDAWNNLGNVRRDCGKLDLAEMAYRQALALDDAHANAWSNIGAVLRARGRLPEAIAALEAAIERAPRMTNAHYNLGSALRSAGRLGEAIRAYARALEIDPTHARAHEMLGRMLHLAGEHDAAAKIFRSWSEVEPENPVPVHMLAACSGTNVPARASDAYVRRTFDDFAASFDEVLLERLDYHAPELVLAALSAALGAPRGAHAVLDAGCGTGLCGPLLRPYARTLTGVDLSPRMLHKARARATYDALVEHELVAYMREHASEFDVVASADTLCYFGDLAEAFAAARSALRPRGWFAFSVERADGADAYRINPHGRYSHARDYVAATLARTGFGDAHVTEAVLRREAGAPVEGLVVRAQATG